MPEEKCSRISSLGTMLMLIRQVVISLNTANLPQSTQCPFHNESLRNLSAVGSLGMGQRALRLQPPAASYSFENTICLAASYARKDLRQ